MKDQLHKLSLENKEYGAREFNNRILQSDIDDSNKLKMLEILDEYIHDLRKRGLDNSHIVTNPATLIEINRIDAEERN